MAAQGLRIILGGDDAGFYKTALAADLAADPRVSSVTDASPKSASDKTAYPHYAVAAAQAVARVHGARQLQRREGGVEQQCAGPVPRGESRGFGASEEVG
ncbi:ribose 5-phosphate isomerase [Camillea tinctor]|nr:ribose 5-phosphate isomerase [Camillea tinctor]